MVPFAGVDWVSVVKQQLALFKESTLSMQRESLVVTAMEDTFCVEVFISRGDSPRYELKGEGEVDADTAELIEAYKEAFAALEEDAAKLRKQNGALKGQVTKLRKRLESAD